MRWGDHSSGMCLATHLTQPTRMTGQDPSAISGLSFLFGLAPGGVYHDRRCYQPRGALLPHRFTLIRIIPHNRRKQADGIVSVALSLGSPPPAVSRHRFPVEPGLSSLFRKEHSDRPTIWLGCLCLPAGGGSSGRQDEWHYQGVRRWYMSGEPASVMMLWPARSTRT